MAFAVTCIAAGMLARVLQAGGTTFSTAVNSADTVRRPLGGLVAPLCYERCLKRSIEEMKEKNTREKRLHGYPIDRLRGLTSENFTIIRTILRQSDDDVKIFEDSRQYNRSSLTEVLIEQSYPELLFPYNDIKLKYYLDSTNTKYDDDSIHLVLKPGDDAYIVDYSEWSAYFQDKLEAYKKQADGGKPIMFVNVTLHFHGGKFDTSLHRNVLVFLNGSNIIRFEPTGYTFNDEKIDLNITSYLSKQISTRLNESVDIRNVGVAIQDKKYEFGGLSTNGHCQHYAMMFIHFYLQEYKANNNEDPDAKGMQTRLLQYYSNVSSRNFKALGETAAILGQFRSTFMQIMMKNLPIICPEVDDYTLDHQFKIYKDVILYAGIDFYKTYIKTKRKTRTNSELSFSRKNASIIVNAEFSFFLFTETAPQFFVQQVLPYMEELAHLTNEEQHDVKLVFTLYSKVLDGFKHTVIPIEKVPIVELLRREAQVYTI